jgi:hypothetical protein
MRISPLLNRAVLAALAVGCAATLAGCSEVAVIKTAAPAAAGFDARYGNDPLAAADGASLESALRSRGQVWSIRISTEPSAAGYVKVSDLNALVAARGKVRSFAMTLTATAQSTLQGFSARGPQGEQAYLESLMQAIANAGYARITSVRIDVWFQASHHAVLTWTSAAGFKYSVLDGKP